MDDGNLRQKSVLAGVGGLVGVLVGLNGVFELPHVLLSSRGRLPDVVPLRGVSCEGLSELLRQLCGVAGQDLVIVFE